MVHTMGEFQWVNIQSVEKIDILLYNMFRLLFIVLRF